MKWPIATAIAATAMIGTVGFWSSSRVLFDTKASAMVVPQAAFGDADFVSARQTADKDVSQQRTLLSSGKDQWLRHETLAIALMQRFRLTGNQQDLDEARSLLDEATAMAPKPSGPNLSRAILALTEHDLERSEEAINRFELAAVKSTRDRADAAAMRGDIAFQRGQLKTAATLYASANKLEPSLGSQLRLAEIQLRTGDPVAARDITRRALQEFPVVPAEYARVSLLLANQSYAAGDVDGAGEWIKRANAAFPGYWLAEAYQAQHLAVEGDVHAAISALEGLANAYEEPEILDALSGVLSESGDQKRADEWSARAATLWEQKLRTARDSYRLHAAEHYLDFGDPARALILAKEEVALRPTPSAIEVMASALNANGQPKAALEWLDKANDAGWSMTSLHLARSDALAALGRHQEALDVLEEASAGATLAGDPRRPLVRFGHY